MKAEDFLETFIIDPEKHIEPNFDLVKEIDIDTLRHNGNCFNCNAYKMNTKWYNATGWCNIQYCCICEHINVVYGQDRMVNSTDIVMCYVDKLAEKRDEKINKLI